MIEIVTGADNDGWRGASNCGASHGYGLVQQLRVRLQLGEVALQWWDQRSALGSIMNYERVSAENFFGKYPAVPVGAQAGSQRAMKD